MVPFLRCPRTVNFKDLASPDWRGGPRRISSSILAGADTPKPADIPSEDAARHFGDDCLFFGALRFIFEVGVARVQNARAG